MAIAARDPPALLAAKVGIARELEGLREGAVVLAAVVVLTGGRLIGERARRDEVPAAHLLGRLPQIQRDDVDEALEVVGGLGATSAPVGSDGRRVGEDARGLEIDVRDLVDPDPHHEREVGDEGEDGVGADVGRHAHAKRGDRAVVLHRGFEVGDLGAPVGRRHHVLEARLDPPERHPVEAGERGERRVLRVETELHAEATADLGRDHAHEVLRQAERRGEIVPEAVRRLGRGPHDDAARGRIGRRHRRARLERNPAEPLAHHALLDDALGARKGRVGLARLDLVPVLDVPGRVVIELRRARRHRRERVGHGGQGLPVHDDLGRRVHRERLRGGDDRGDGLARVAHPVHRERVVLASDVVAVGPAAFGAGTFEWQGGAQPADLLAGDDLEHAGALRRRGGVDLRDARVRVRASHERDVVHARQHDVGDVAGAARDEPRVFLALHFGAHQSRCGHFTLSPQVVAPFLEY